MQILTSDQLILKYLATNSDKNLPLFTFHCFHMLSDSVLYTESTSLLLLYVNIDIIIIRNVK